MGIVKEIEKLTADPAASGWVPQPGLAELRDFLRTMNEKGLVVKRPYDLPLPDYSGVQRPRDPTAGQSR